jgi:drug/metabolite transporter (DMT)-like permease
MHMHMRPQAEALMPKWLVYSIVTFAIWGTWGFVTELAGRAGVPALGNLVLFTIGLIPAAAVALLSPGVKVGTDKRRGLLWGFATGLAGGLGNVAVYRAFELGKTAVVYPLTGIYPLVTLAVAWACMRERLNRVQALGVIAAVLAVFVATAKPETWSDPAAFATALGTSWMGFTLIAVVFWGLTGVTQKLATNHISAELSLLGFVTGFVPLTAFVLLFTDTPFTFGAGGWAWGILGGSLMGFGTLASLAAFRSGGKASVVTALTGLNPVLTVLLMVWVLRESLEWFELAGAATAMGAGLALSYERAPAETVAPGPVAGVPAAGAPAVDAQAPG